MEQRERKLRKAYRPPGLIVHGDITQLTQASVIGTRLDGDYQYGTLLSQGILS